MYERDRQVFLLKRTERRDPTGDVAMDWKGFPGLLQYYFLLCQKANQSYRLTTNEIQNKKVQLLTFRDLVFLLQTHSKK